MSVDAFISTVWSKKWIDTLDPQLIYAKGCNRDYEGEIKQAGDTVRIPTIGPITVSTYTKNTNGLTPEIIQGAAQSMVIDQTGYFFFELDDVDKAQTNVSTMDKALERATFAMKKQIDDFLSALMAAGVHEDNVLETGDGISSSATNPILVGSGNLDAYELLVDIGTRLNEANVPGGSRFVIVNPKFVAELLKDSRFSGFATAGAMEMMKAGSSAGGEMGNLTPMLKMLTGLTMYVSNQVPVTGAVYTLIAGYDGATSFATQLADGQPEAFRLQTGFADAMRGLQLYGGKVLEPAGLASAYVQFAAA